ncbi:hypothetical protein [Sphaerisporangium corydalis]|uniref:DUF1707 domain-containing protein n=1 Tax=Sphaerisporangium corydalis TaxID=1441875 RepID=A0ABV9EGX0_9ACTN|nr:hypothetical protein [Sphaerisporangium corydalis]
MNADDLVESYVSDVARLLPRKQRDDVALELRTLLRDELEAKAATAGRPADEEMARELLTGFGPPREAAARYRPHLTIIDPADSRGFLRVAGGGIAVIWLLGLLAAFQRRPVGSAGDVLAVLRDWWLSVGPQVLWWPGLLVVCYATAAFVRRRRPESGAWKPRRGDRDRINRVGYLAAGAFFVSGTLVLIDPGRMLEYVTGGRAAPAAYQAFVYDDDFFRHRAPWLLAFMVLHLAFYGVMIVRGRWNPLTRQIDIALGLTVCAILTWVLLAGDIFEARPTDQLTKTAITLIVITSLVDLSLKLRRQWRRITHRPYA